MKARVLLIDEAQLERKINDWTLAHGGYDVVSAGSGEQALRLARDRTPDVVVVDPLLPDVQGRPILAELKDNCITGRIPIIVLARAGLWEAERLRQGGATEVLDKEKALSDGRLLLDTVEGVLHPVL